MKKNWTHLALAASACLGTQAFAETRFGDYVSLSGFGTLGVASSDSSAADFVRDGAPKGTGGKASWNVDSKLGVQADVKANEWLSATVQVLAEQRYEPGVKADFEWAFVKIKPMDKLNIRLGRTAPAMFMVSDTRNVGYANVMVRQPNEVYSLAGLKRLTGGDASYGFSIAGTTLTVQGMAGKSEVKNSPTAGVLTLEAKNVRGLNAVWDTDYGSFRLGHVKADVVVPANVSPTGAAFTTGYTFTGLGYQWDNQSTVVSAEYVERKVTPTTAFNAKGWYVMGGYRFGKFLPYAVVANASTEDPKVNWVGGNQRSYGAGVRWDVVTGAAIKVQLERVDPKNTLGTSFSLQGQQPAKTNVLSVVVDFVF